MDRVYLATEHPTMRYYSTVFILLVTLQIRAQSTVESVPNQKLINGSYVSNPDNILNETTVAQIDTLLGSLEKKTSVQVAVVAVHSIGSADVFDFAQELFTKWGVGNRDNGLLILLVTDIHTIRFHTGYGVEGLLPDVVCKRIQRDHMLPAFKRNDYDAGMIAGLQELASILSKPAAVEELSATEKEASNWVGFVTFIGLVFILIASVSYIIKTKNGTFKDSKNPEDTPYLEMRISRWTWLLIFIAVPMLIVVMYSVSETKNPSVECFLTLYFYFMATLLFRWWREKKVINRFLSVESYYGIVEFIRKQQWYWFFMGLLFPLPFLPYFFYHLARKKIYRNHPRNCKQCQGKMSKLSEVKEDEFLTAEQKAEEILKSVDYDVWKCESCGSIDMSFFLNRNTEYTTCPKCETIAFHLSENNTIEGATYTKAGSGEEVHSCEFCGYEAREKYIIPKRVHSTSSSITSGSGSSYGGGSSSSGGSWGGGRSGGGGASSSW